MATKKRVLILTADAGFGHRSAANAVRDAILDKYCDHLGVEVINPLDEPTTPALLRDTQSEYDKFVKHVPELYYLGYEVSDRPVPTAFLERAIAVMLVDTMRELFLRHKPDVVLSTYPWYPPAMTALFINRKYRTPNYTVVTDLSTVHRMWFHKKATGCLVPNQIVADLAMSGGVPSNRISITGIPVSPAIIKETRSKAEIRAELGWQSDLSTILAVGSKRVERLVDSLHVVNHFGGPLQVAVVCGKDEGLFNQLNQFNWHVPAHVYEYSDRMPTLMKAADLMLCKAGGLIVTESLASGLPLLITEAIPGQETGNAEYVLAYGAGDLAESPIAILECLSHLMRDGGALLKERSAKAAQIGQPKSAYMVADILYQSATRNDAKRAARKGTSSKVSG